jgi:hypothetical protein
MLHDHSRDWFDPGGAASRATGAELKILSGAPRQAAKLVADAVCLRRQGVRFAISLEIEDARVHAVREHSAAFCAQYDSWDEVRLRLDQVAEKISNELPVVRDAERDLLWEAMRLSDLIVVRSQSAHARLRRIFGALPRDVEVVVDEYQLFPMPSGGPRTDVVVYAPHFRADELGVFATALADINVPVTIIARDRPTIPSGAIRFVAPELAAGAIADARVIVEADADDPGAALALARLGCPLAVCSRSGAAEILRGAFVYEAWNRRSVLAAVQNALAGQPPSVRTGCFDLGAVERAHPSFGSDAPLISVVVATCDRPTLLARSLMSIARQSYPNVEIVVVNDGTIDVSAVAGKHSRTQLVTTSGGRGPAAARNAGVAASHGSLLTFFDDDDEMFPDHLSELANALATTGSDVAYGQMINEITGAEGSTRYLGHDALLDHADVQWAGALAPTAVLFRRSVYDEIGPQDERLDVAEDYDYWHRLVEGRECARVDQITSIYSIRLNGSNWSARKGAAPFLAAHEAIYAKHPSSRPLIAAGREAMLEYFRTAG